MNKQEQERTIELTKDLVHQLRQIMDNHATEVSLLDKQNSDPHTPIIGLLQMAMAQAATEFMINNGSKMDEAIHAVISTTQQAMQHWINSLTKPR